MTRLIQVDPRTRGDETYRRAIEEWRELLESGGICGFATDTVWAVGALADRPAGVERIYALKGRDRAQPLACLVPTVEAARRYAAVWSDPVDRLVRRHWPGPLTVVIPTVGEPFPAASRGTATLGFRVPARPVLLDLLAALDRPLAATSANESGRPALADGGAVEATLGKGLDLIVSDMLTVSGMASTVVEWAVGGLRVLRRGSIDPAR